MGRHAEGWKLQQDPRNGLYKVRFTHAGRRWKLATATRDLGDATREAARLYGEVVSGRFVPGRVAQSGGRDFIEVASAWLADIESSVDAKTFGLYSNIYVGTHFAPFFGTVDGLTTTGAETYVGKRLAEVGRETVKKELSVLRRFARWAARRGYIEMPVIDTPGARVLGTAVKSARKKDFQIFSADEVSRIIAKLPERVSAPKIPEGFWVRARIAVLWETGLRPTTVSRLRAPEDFSPGKSVLSIRAEVDKNRWGRDLPLSTAARAALDSVCPAEGVIFGVHDTRGALREAAKAAGIDAQRADRISEYDLRHSRLTLWGSTTTNLSALMYLAGHTQPATSARYLRPQIEAAAEVVAGAENTPGRGQKNATRGRKKAPQGDGKAHRGRKKLPQGRAATAKGRKRGPKS
jgi:integrase